MRTFIAIELPKEIKTSLSRLQEQLKRTGADVRWVEPGNIHLTLKFLGEIDTEHLEKINLILEQTARKHTPFKTNISSLGAFPKIGFPRVIWVGIRQGDEETKKIAGYLEEEIEKIGIAKENKAFSSHITIGRVRSQKSKEKLIRELNNLAGYFGKENLAFTIKKITLFKSNLSPKGPTYEILKTANLKIT